jgi:hypothetical protein
LFLPRIRMKILLTLSPQLKKHFYKSSKDLLLLIAVFNSMRQLSSSTTVAQLFQHH